MRLDGITISVNYSDYLAWSLPTAKNIFDRLIVVTSKEDRETKKICDYYYVECVQTDLMTKDGKFNKGAGINIGLDILNSKDWVCHWDADTVFPPRFNEFIRSKNLDKDCLYGVDRLSVKDWDTWIRFICSPNNIHYVGSLWANFPIMYRVVQGMSYIPIGYFQMWNTQSKYYKKYSTASDTAADSDLDFARNWPSEKRLLIPEVYVYHLESEQAIIGANWKGRKTKKFGPKDES